MSTNAYFCTVTGQLADATGAPIHATIDFVSKSTPLAAAGVITTNTDTRILSNPADGTFSLALASGNYQVNIAADGQATSFNIAVPAGGSATIDTLVTTPLVYPFIVPNTIWDGTRAGNITFLPMAPPPAPTFTEITYTGGTVDGGDTRFSYFVSYVTATGETSVSAQLDVHLGTDGNATADRANRIIFGAIPNGVTALHLWRTTYDNGHPYDNATFPHGVGLLAVASPATAYYDDWESTAQFAARASGTISPVFNTTAGQLLSNAGTVCAYVSPQGLIIPAPLTLQSSLTLAGSNVRLTPGVGLELYNFDTQLWQTLLVTGNPATLALSAGHA